MSVLPTWRRDETDLGLYESRDELRSQITTYAEWQQHGNLKF